MRHLSGLAFIATVHSAHHAACKIRSTTRAFRGRGDRQAPTFRSEPESEGGIRRRMNPPEAAGRRERTALNLWESVGPTPLFIMHVIIVESMPSFEP